jgi:predicted RNA-binding protein with PIN domain
LPSRDLVIDGYNFIFRLAPDTEFKPGEIGRLRTALEAAVLRHGQSRGLRPWIVYDGRRVGVSHAGARELEHLRVSYAEPPAEADDMICQIAGQIRAEGRSVEVVTSDAGLAERLRELGVESLPVEAFHDRLVTARIGIRPQVGDIEAHFLALESAATDVEEPAASACEDPPARSPDATASANGGSVAGAAGPSRERRRRRGQRRQQRRLEALRRQAGKRRRQRR